MKKQSLLLLMLFVAGSAWADISKTQLSQGEGFGQAIAAGRIGIDANSVASDIRLTQSNKISLTLSISFMEGVIQDGNAIWAPSSHPNCRMYVLSAPQSVSHHFVATSRFSNELKSHAATEFSLDQVFSQSKLDQLYAGETLHNEKLYLAPIHVYPIGDPFLSAWSAITGHAPIGNSGNFVLSFDINLQKGIIPLTLEFSAQ